MNLDLLFYSVALCYLCVSFVCVLMNYSTLKRMSEVIEVRIRYVINVTTLTNGLKMLQIPYLFNIDSPLFLFYVTVVDLLVYLPLNILFWIYYLDILQQQRKVLYTLFALSAGMILAIAWMVFYHPSSLVVYKNNLFWSVLTLLISQLVLFMIFIFRGYRSEILSYKMNFSNDQQFPKSYILPSASVIILGLLLNIFSFIGQSNWIKMFITLYFTGLMLYVRLYWIPHNYLFSPITVRVKKYLGEHKKEETYIPESKEDETGGVVDSRDALYQSILENVNKEIRERALYLNPELHLSDLLPYLNTNRTYLSKAINQNEHMNFYRLILSYRIHYLRELMRKHPDIKFNDAAIASGFGSSKSLSRIFRQELDLTPTKFKSMSVREQDDLLQEYKLSLYTEKESNATILIR